jgi:hypothetical protein
MRMPQNNGIVENTETDSWRTCGFSWKRLFNIKATKYKAIQSPKEIGSESAI